MFEEVKRMTEAKHDSLIAAEKFDYFCTIPDQRRVGAHFACGREAIKRLDKISESDSELVV
jgi:hypothetical protein